MVSRMAGWLRICGVIRTPLFVLSSAPFCVEPCVVPTGHGTVEQRGVAARAGGQPCPGTGEQGVVPAGPGSQTAEREGRSPLRPGHDGRLKMKGPRERTEQLQSWVEPSEAAEYNPGNLDRDKCGLLL